MLLSPPFAFWVFSSHPSAASHAFPGFPSSVLSSASATCLCLELSLPQFQLLEMCLESTSLLAQALGFLYLHPYATFTLPVQFFFCHCSQGPWPSPLTNRHRSSVPSPRLPSPADLHPSPTQTYKTKLARITYFDKQASRQIM